MDTNNDNNSNNNNSDNNNDSNNNNNNNNAFLKVNAILKEIKSDNITETNRLIRACAIFVGRKVGLKPYQRAKETWTN